jgi:hypothetical protein
MNFRSAPTFVFNTLFGFRLIFDSFDVSSLSGRESLLSDTQSSWTPASLFCTALTVQLLAIFAISSWIIHKISEEHITTIFKVDE